MPDVESPEHEPGYSDAVRRAGTTDEERVGMLYSRDPPEPATWTGGDAMEREADRARLVNCVAAYVREMDRKMTEGQPGCAYVEVHKLDDAFTLFERRTVMRWNREQARATEATAG